MEPWEKGKDADSQTDIRQVTFTDRYKYKYTDMTHTNKIRNKIFRYIYNLYLYVYKYEV